MRYVFLLFTLPFFSCLVPMNSAALNDGVEVDKYGLIDLNKTITIDEELPYDNEVLESFKLKFLKNGFNVISEKVAVRKDAVSNPTTQRLDQNGRPIPWTFNKQYNSQYVMFIEYNTTPVNACGNGLGINSLSAEIIDVENDGKILLTVSYKSRQLESTCPTYLAQAIAVKIKDSFN